MTGTNWVVALNTGFIMVVFMGIIFALVLIAQKNSLKKDL